MLKRIHYTVENLLRPTAEYYSAITLVIGAGVLWQYPYYFPLTPLNRYAAIATLLALGGWRTWQGLTVTHYKKRLLKVSYFALSTDEIPLNEDYLYLGHGFQWTARHTQRLHMLNDQRFEQFTQQRWLYAKIRLWEKHHPGHWLNRFTQSNAWYNPVKPLPPIGGKPWIHGLGHKEEAIFIPQKLRTGHMLVFGTTGVGKTRFASMLINQDIRNGEAVLVLDPKGDLELMQSIYSACNAAGRLDDFLALHVGFPKYSAHYNPLSSFDSVSEVATRVVSGITEVDSGAVFKDFAWKFINIVANCLLEMKKRIHFKSIAFYITRLDLLLTEYANIVYPNIDPDFELQNYRESIKEAAKAAKEKKELTEADIIKQSLAKHIQQKSSDGRVESIQDQIIIELLDASLLDKQYYDKITASVGPVFAKINQSPAANLFSFKGYPDNEINLMEVIRKRKVVYIGLDAMNNAAIAKAVGKAVIADLVSLAGKIYKNNLKEVGLCVHSDEFSEIVEEQFVTLLNKGRGAGMKVTAYSQTVNDIEAAFAGNTAKAKMAEGNFNTLMMLRVENTDTANTLAAKLPQITVFSQNQHSSVNDSLHRTDGTHFTSSNSDGIQTTSTGLLNMNDLISLPTGQAFVFTNGGELYKIRAPLPKQDDTAPKNVHQLLAEVNNKTHSQPSQQKEPYHE